VSTFLELCQKVARESGTVSGTLPSSVASQTGRLGKIVFWTADAWRQIQNRRSAWLWMRDEFGSPDAVTSAGSKRYTAASWNLTRLAEWIIDDDTVTIYLQATGVSDEGPIKYLPWHLYRRQYERGAQEQNRPVHFTVSPANEFCLGPTPDDTYVVRGEYRKTPQELTANGDIPEMPLRFHELVAWYGFLLMAEHDEGPFHIAVATRRKRELLDELERDQLPQMTLPEALA
jgi:hypothetical protein